MTCWGWEAKLREIEAVVSPITASLYDGGDAKDVMDDGPEDEPLSDDL